ncbi:hypothetical protein [Clavibacter tessellarius]|uniref:poly(ethylene terephthalate) hydrolase family protein n=1 Tax=Clavibacter tessellarius TaxID=31965 RepID=UPI00324D4033
MSVMSSALRRPAAVAALALVATLAIPTAAQASAPVHHPAPSTARHHHAPFAVRTTVVPKKSVKAFGGGVLYEPQDTGKPVLGAVVITPGFTDTSADEKEYAERSSPRRASSRSRSTRSTSATSPPTGPPRCSRPSTGSRARAR